MDVTEELDAVAPLRDLAEGTEDLIVCLSSAHDGTLLWVSAPGLESILGYSPEEVVGQSGLALLDGIRQISQFEDDLAVVREGAATAARYEARHELGHHVPVRVTGWRVNEDVALGLAVRAV